MRWDLILSYNHFKSISSTFELILKFHVHRYVNYLSYFQPISYKRKVTRDNVSHNLCASLSHKPNKLKQIWNLLVLVIVNRNGVACLKYGIVPNPIMINGISPEHLKRCLTSMFGDRKLKLWHNVAPCEYILNQNNIFKLLDW